MATDQWLVWQLADSAFPAGGLAHSNGLEAGLQCGLVSDTESLEAFVRAALRQSMRGVLGFVLAAHRSPADFAAIDRRCDLFLNNHVTNRASRAQGQAFLAASARIFCTEPLMQLTQQIRDTKAPAHLAPIYGMVLGSLGIREAKTQRLFLFVFIRSCMSAAVRLGIVGPLEAQRIQSRINHEALEAHALPVQTAPVLDLLQATQDRLYSRLFQS